MQKKKLDFLHVKVAYGNTQSAFTKGNMLPKGIIDEYKKKHRKKQEFNKHLKIKQVVELFKDKN